MSNLNKRIKLSFFVQKKMKIRNLKDRLNATLNTVEERIDKQTYKVLGFTRYIGSGIASTVKEKLTICKINLGNLKHVKLKFRKKNRVKRKRHHSKR